MSSKNLKAFGLFLGALALVAPSGASAQPVGTEFRVNVTTTSSQYHSRVATISNVGYIVIWDSEATGTKVVMGQRLDTNGGPTGPEFVVHPDTAAQYTPAVGSDVAGNFTVVWERGKGIWAQRYDFSGSPLGSDFRVDASTTFVGRPAVAYGSSGEILVVWEESDEGDAEGIYARRFAASGSSLTGSFRVNTFTTSHQQFATVAGSSAGFVVAWSSTGQAGEDKTGVYAQRYSAAGAPVAGEFHVNASTTGYDDEQTIAMNRFDSSFVIVWRGGNDGSADAVVGQRYAASGAPVGGEFRINTSTTGSQAGPWVAWDSASTFVVAWSNAPGAGFSVLARQFAANGSPLGEFRLDSSVANTPSATGIASASSTGGRFLVLFDQGDGGGSGVFGRTGCLVGDANADGVVDVADVFYVINALFAGGPGAAGCVDVDGSGAIDIADVFYLINYLFASGPPPV
jgi:hypothetical protein